MSFLSLAIAGDLHGSWIAEDQDLLIKLSPDAVLFVGDLGEGDIGLVKEISNIPLPTAVILGNHDRGRDETGKILKLQLKLLGDRHCGWGLRKWKSPQVSVVGARPCSAGGGFHLSSAVEAVFGALSVDESAERIVRAVKDAPINIPLVILAHSGPSGLGSDASSPCGRDWRLPAIDWGDTDLSIALDRVRKDRIPDLVVFGHMHHQLKRGTGSRCTFFEDRWGTVYLNAACVPRRGITQSGESLCHFSWVEFVHGQLNHVSHRWYRADTSIAYKQNLLDRNL